MQKEIKAQYVRVFSDMDMTNKPMKVDAFSKP